MLGGIVFWEFLTKISPLYILVMLGWIAGRYLQASGRHIAGIMLYILTPSVVFSGVIAAPLTPELLLLPVITFSTCTTIGLLYRKLGRRWLADGSESLLPLAVGTGNTGYFGIPLALLLFGEEGLSLYILAMLGTTLFENSVGFYCAARGRYSVREAVVRLARLPSLYAFIAAAALNLSGLRLPEPLAPLFENMRGAYSVFGMMLIGMSMQALQGMSRDLKFTALTFFGKFLVWPLTAGVIITLDRWMGFNYGTAVHQVLFLISITPVAANTVVIATLMDNYPRRAATAAMLSILFALIYIPLMLPLMPG